MDTISIRIPASPVYVQVVRLIASGLATRLGFTLDDIDDLKIGVDEMCSYLTGTQGRAGELEITFSVGDDRIDIAGTGHFEPGEKVRTELTDFSQKILETVASDAALFQADGTPSFKLAKIKTS